MDELSVPAPVHKLHNTGDLGKERVVLAAADVIARLDPGAALADQDRPAGDQLSAEPLDAEALRLRVAPVSGTAQTFLCAIVYTVMSLIRTCV